MCFALRHRSRDESSAHLGGPGLSQRAKLAEFNVAVRDGAQGTVLDIAERAQHSRHIPQRRLLGTPLFDAVAGFALEVDDHEVVTRHQHLTQMIVAMDAYLLPLRFFRSGRFEPCDEPILVRQHIVGLVAIGRRDFIDARLQQAERVTRFGQRALAVTIEIGAGKRLRIEISVARAGCQRSMQFGRALGQRANHDEIRLVGVDGQSVGGGCRAMHFEMTP